MKIILLLLFISFNLFADDNICIYVTVPVKYQLSSECSQHLCKADIICFKSEKTTKHPLQECLSDISGDCPQNPKSCLDDTRLTVTKVTDIPLSNEPTTKQRNTPAAER